jgi:hypothetical protein
LVEELPRRRRDAAGLELPDPVRSTGELDHAHARLEEHLSKSAPATEGRSEEEGGVDAAPAAKKKAAPPKTKPGKGAAKQAQA